MRGRSEAGNGIVAVLLVLAILGGAGFWNYQRNLEAEKQVYRPFRTHTDEQLAQLSAAYESEKAGDAERYQNAAGRRATPDSKAYFDQQVREFERVQQAGETKKRLQAEVAESVTTLKLLSEEQRLRAAERDRVKLFFKRLLTI